MTTQGAPGLHYGVHQRTGRKFQNWINGDASGTGEQPSVQRSTLTINDIAEIRLSRTARSRLSRHVRELGEEYGLFLTSHTFVEYWVYTDQPRASFWGGVVTPGNIVIHDMARENGPFMSDVSLALFKNHYVIHDLERVFLMDIQNEDTYDLITTEIYQEWPENPEEKMLEEWEYGTPQYQALLGTELGKIVANLVLGAFERGTRQISRIVTWQDEINTEPQMRFDIDRVQEVKQQSDSEWLPETSSDSGNPPKKRKLNRANPNAERKAAGRPK